MRALVQCAVAVTILVGVLRICEGATQAQIDDARTKGLAWLFSEQKGDGSWRATPGTEVAATATGLEALRAAGLTTGYPFAASASWVNNTTIVSVDSLARKVRALQPSSIDVGPAAQTLLAWRNRLSAWGAYDQFETTFPDTPLAIGALRLAQIGASDAEIAAAMCRITTGQITGAASAGGGSWGYTNRTLTFSGPQDPPLVSFILPTTANLLEISATQMAKGWSGVTCNSTSYTFSTVITNGVTWLTTQRRNADGGFGDTVGTSAVFETALVYELLRAVAPTNAATMPALDYLIARQSANGSWNSDALQTALVLKVLPPPLAPLVDTDNDGIPDAVEVLLGTNPTVADSRWLAKGNGNPGGETFVPMALAAARADTSLQAAAASEGSTTTVISLDPVPAADGDLNGDGAVDAADVALAERIVLGLAVATAHQTRHGDVSPAGAPDGVIDLADVQRIRRKAVGLEPF